MDSTTKPLFQSKHPDELISIDPVLLDKFQFVPNELSYCSFPLFKSTYPDELISIDPVLLKFQFVLNELSYCSFPLFKSTYPDELISIDPVLLKFQFVPNKLSSCSFQLSNKSDKHVAFRVKTSNLKKYTVQPKNGIILPGSQSIVTVTMQAQKEYPSDLSCQDMFLVQSAAAPLGPTLKVTAPEMFNNEAGNHVDECRLRVVHIYPESESEEEETSKITPGITTAVSSGSYDHQVTFTKKLWKEGPRRHYSGSNYYVLLIVLLAVLLGYYIRKWGEDYISNKVEDNVGVSAPT